MQIKCSHCGQTLTVPDNTDAAQGKCSGCGRMVDIRAAERLGVGPGDTLGNFRIDSLIGRGGMATVYRATQLSLDRPVAIKVLHHQLAKRKQFVGRFEREGKLLAQLSHPNIVGIVAVGATDDGTYYLAMEYVQGETLRDRLKREGRLPFEEAAQMVDAVAAGLEHAHEHGVLHRDIKPDNVLIGPDGVPKVVDFGIARMTGAETLAQQRLTVAKTLMGSAHYMAPEQMEDAATVDHRADVYALGVLFYELLTGKLPIGQFEPASAVADGVPILADRLIRHALAAKPEQRVQTVAQFRTFLQRMLAPGVPPPSHFQPHRRPKKSSAPAVLGVVAVLAATAIAVVALRGGKKDDQAVVPERERQTVGTKQTAPPPEPKGKPPPVHTKASPPPEKKAEPGPEVRAEPPKPAVDATPEVRVEPPPKLKVTPPEPEKTDAEPRPEPPPDPAEMYRKALATLRPLWRKRQYANAVTAARGMGEPGAIRDAEALAGFWEAVEASATRLKPGDTIRARGMPATVTKVEADTIHVSAGPVTFALRLAELTDTDAVALAEKTRPLTSGPDLLALALLHLEDEKPDAAKARAAIAVAAKAGVDTSRHEALLPAEGTPEPEAQKPGKWVILFDGTSMGKWQAMKELSGRRKCGSVEVIKGALILNGKSPPRAMVQFTGRVHLGMSYEIAFDAMLVEGDKLGGLVLPVGKTCCTWVLSAADGTYTGLEPVDGKDCRGNPTSRRMQLAEGQWYAARLRVTPASIAAWIGPMRTFSLTGVKERFGSDDVTLTAGQLGYWTNHSRVALRNIRVRTLPEGTGEAKPEPRRVPVGAWVSLFDGRNLDGWERRGGEWAMLEDGICVSVGHSDGKLIDTRNSYRNFEFECDTLNDGIGFRFGILFRVDGSDAIFFCLNDQHDGIALRAGTSFMREKSRDLTIQGAPTVGLRTVESRKWYRLRVQCQGERIRCYIDDRLVAEGRDPSPRQGHVGLCARRTVKALFRNIRIRKLSD